MAIRLNLLAEAQAEEELRRKDPVKRAIWGGVILVCLGLVWSSSLQLKALIAKGELSRVNALISAQNADYQVVVENRKKLNDVRHKLASLTILATNRYLHGTVLNELQHAIVEDVQLLRLKTEHLYAQNEAVKAITNANGRITPGQPASVTERVVLTLEARDSAANPGDQVNKYKNSLNKSDYFMAALAGTNEVRLANLSPPQGGGGTRPYVLFSLECRYPEKTR